MTTNWTEFQKVENFDDFDSLVGLLKDPDLKQYRDQYYLDFKNVFIERGRINFLWPNLDLEDVNFLQAAVMNDVTGKFLNREFDSLVYMSTTPTDRLIKQKIADDFYRFGWKVHVASLSPDFSEPRVFVDGIFGKALFDGYESSHKLAFVDFFVERLEPPTAIEFFEFCDGRFQL